MAEHNKKSNKHIALVLRHTPKYSSPAKHFMRILRRHLPEIRERYKVESLAVFGSYVRDEQKGGSDLDVLIEFFETPSLFEFLEVEQYLSDLLGVKIDLVMKNGLKPRIGRHILDEIVPI
jgi:hypothetical protein